MNLAIIAAFIVRNESLLDKILEDKPVLIKKTPKPDKPINPYIVLRIKRKAMKPMKRIEATAKAKRLRKAEKNRLYLQWRRIKAEIQSNGFNPPRLATAPPREVAKPGRLYPGDM